MSAAGMTDAGGLLVDPHWLAGRLDDGPLVVIDGSWHMPDTGRDARGEYDAAHIPGAVFVDIDTLCDDGDDLPHMMPGAAAFSSFVGGQLGITARDLIVVYDSVGVFSSARVWWMFRAMGARDVRLLNGGLPAWKAAGFPVENTPVNRPARQFAAQPDNAMIAGLDDVATAVARNSAQIIDARPAERFTGKVAEPRPGVRSGHMPGACSLPFTELVKDGKMESDPRSLATIFRKAGVDLDRPLVTSCGSGVTAAILSLALILMGHENHRLYDGSWTEWGLQDESAAFPVVKSS